MPEILFKMKPGVGTHTMKMDGKIVRLRPGDEIRCEKYQLGSALDKFDQLEPDPPPPEPSVGLKPVNRGRGRWDVINETTGDAVNDKALNREEAFELASKGLEGGADKTEEGETGDQGKERDSESGDSNDESATTDQSQSPSKEDGKED